MFSKPCQARNPPFMSIAGTASQEGCHFASGILSYYQAFNCCIKNTSIPHLGDCASLLKLITASATALWDNPQHTHSFVLPFNIPQLIRIKTKAQVTRAESSQVATLQSASKPAAECLVLLKNCQQSNIAKEQQTAAMTGPGALKGMNAPSPLPGFLWLTAAGSSHAGSASSGNRWKSADGGDAYNLAEQAWHCNASRCHKLWLPGCLQHPTSQVRTL